MDFNLFGILGVASVAVICYLVGNAIKVSKINDELIPVICGAVGGILGAIAFFIKIPDFLGEDIYTAIARGIVSGFAATGINQAVKQVKKFINARKDLTSAK